MSTILSSQTPPSPASEEVLLSSNLPIPVLDRLMTNRRHRFIATMHHAMLHRGLVALVLPLGLVFLAFVAHG